MVEGEAAAAAAAEVDMDMWSEGTLVWVRRPNGTWWPGLVISPLEVPADCPAPRRGPATPIKLLGRRDGPPFIDWCNLQRAKRVKPFRCGEVALEDAITMAVELEALRIRQAAAAAAASNKRSRACSTTAVRYARKEDAILQALQIESARATTTTATAKPSRSPSHCDAAATAKPSKSPSHCDTATAKPSRSPSHCDAAATAKPSKSPSHCDAAAATAKPSKSPSHCDATAAVIHPTSPKRKRRTPNDSEDDLPPRARRMKDLSDIGSNSVPSIMMSNALTLPGFNCHLHSNRTDAAATTAVAAAVSVSAKRRRSSLTAQDQVMASSRKKDRSRPLSELCNGDMWNRSKTNGRKADLRLMDIGSCSGSSSGTLSLDTVLDKCSLPLTGARKTDQAKGTEISCMTGLLNCNFPRENNCVGTSLPAGHILEAGHLQAYRPSASAKDPSCKLTKQAIDCSKAGLSPRCDRRNSKKKIIASVDLEGNSRTTNVPEPEYQKNRVVKYEAPSSEVILLDQKGDKSLLHKPAGPDGSKLLAVFSTELDCVVAVQQQCSETKREQEVSLEIISRHSDCEIVLASSPDSEMPLQVLPPQQRLPEPARCHAVKPTKTLQLNPALYDVELSVLGRGNEGRRVPLVSLMSKWNRRPVVGYPVSVEVSDVVCCLPAASIDDHHPAAHTVNGLLKKDEAAGMGWQRPSKTGIDDHRPAKHTVNGLLKKDKAAAMVCQRPSQTGIDYQHPATHTVDGLLKKDEAADMGCRRPSRTGLAKPKNRKKVSEHEMDKSWLPHTKRAPVTSPRKMRRLSSFATSRRGGGERRLVIGNSGTTIACIPLRVVFSRINEALSYQVK